MRKFLLQYFDFSRQEKRSVLFLLIVLVLLLCVRMLLPVMHSGFNQIDEGLLLETQAFIEDIRILEYEKSVALQKKNEPEIIITIQEEFDPNHIEPEKLLSFGFPGNIVKNLEAYRKAGGKFFHPEDFMKVYGMELLDPSEILPYIFITNNSVSQVESVRDTATHATMPVNLNSCSYKELAEFLGKENRLAGRILNYRDLLGGYTNLQQLLEVYGMTDSVYNTLGKQINLDTCNIRKLSLTTTEYRDFLRHPYFSREDVDRIISYREFAGGDISMKHFLENQVFPDSILSRITPYLKN